MKNTLLSLFLSFASFCSFAQGNLNFANAGVGVNAPISDAPWHGGARLDGNAFWVQLWWGAAGTTDSDVLVPIGSPVHFLTGAQAGYFTGGTITFPTVPGGTHVVVQVRAWDAADGNTWQGAWNSFSVNFRAGNSSLLDVALTQVPTTPPNLVGLTGFALDIPTPEPSAFALAALAAFAVTSSRKRK